MIGLILAVITFNLLALTLNKNLSENQVAHIWCFTTTFLVVADLYIDIKYHGYWYFSKGVDWRSLLSTLVLIPPVNVLFFNWFPWDKKVSNHIKYFIGWGFVLLVYELLTLLPEPWGYFHYGWWNILYSAVVNPLLLLILASYYKCFIKQE